MTIVTPNDAHFGPADAAAADTGIGVLCEKPLTTTLDKARAGYTPAVRSKNVPFVVAYTYTGFAMVMLARELVHNGDIGEVRKVEAWYPQGWLASKLEADNQKQAAWRVDPAKAGSSGCGGDIGTHAYEFVRFVAGLSAVRLRAGSRRSCRVCADDDFTVLAELNNGVIATITASQVTIEAQNDNGFRVIGTSGTLEWSITDHTVLKHYAAGQPLRVYRQGAEYGYFPASIKPYLRLPSGHPEGFHGALETCTGRSNGQSAQDAANCPKPPHPGIADGVAGMAFIEAAVASSKQDGPGSRYLNGLKPAVALCPGSRRLSMPSHRRIFRERPHGSLQRGHRRRIAPAI